jgi:hypothetical protein
MAAAHHVGGGAKFPMVLDDTVDRGRLKKPVMSARMVKR